jgi:hypothetical protein
MTTATEFRVFQISPLFAGVESSDAESVVAKLTPSGKPAHFSFMLAANFERATQDSQSDSVTVRGEFRISLGQVLLQITPVETTIRSGRPSVTKELGLHKVMFDRVDISKQPIVLSNFGAIRDGLQCLNTN